MALLLHRLGRFAYRRGWLVIVAWVLALGALLGTGIGLGGQMQESFAIPGTESQDAIDHLAAVFPQTAGASARAVVEAPDGASVADAPYREAITLVELEGRTAKEAAEMVGISVSGMKSRVQRGRAQLRELFERCCEIALDARGKPTDFTPRAQPSCKTCS